MDKSIQDQYDRWKATESFLEQEKARPGTGQYYIEGLQHDADTEHAYFRHLIEKRDAAEYEAECVLNGQTF